MNPLETYLKEMRETHSTGATVAETSFYPILANLFNEIGKTLKPKVRCIFHPADRGAGLPDAGFFTADQFQKSADAAPRAGQLPERGVMEVKGPADDVPRIARSEQVKRYSAEYGLVLVTNYRDFLLLGRDAHANPLPLEAFTLAKTEAEFWTLAAHPQKAAKDNGERFTEYLKRVMLASAPLSAPQDVAWFIASYARDAKARMEAVELPALAAVRQGLEDALGMKFTGPKGEHFFRSTLVQTIFYGVFSAWVLWHRENPDRADAFDWQKTAWSLRVPFIRALYDEIATPSKLGPLGLVEVLDWTAAALNRVDRAAFFQKFQDEHAVQYFYEPFLEAFDPDLRKDLGVWYTPPEIVRYQVARVDTVLREELGLPDGLADPNVVVLDPCCGTGAYLVEVLKSIAETLKAKGGEALIASDLKTAAMTRVFGFEILPAPFVVSHLQLGLMLQHLGAPLSAAKNERVGVYLTNSLTGWEPPKDPKTLLFPELQAERDAADSVKRDKKIVVVLGNPPYNGFAGIAVEEERELSNAYRTTKRAPKPQGQGLNDLFVRFYRMAERRIVEKSGRGVVCFISNYAWLEDLSYTGMRERYLEVFNQVWIDNLHGNRIISEYAPDGKTSETVFAIQGQSPGIKVGTGIFLLVKKETGSAENEVLYRDWNQARADDRRRALLESPSTVEQYQALKPLAEIGYPFKPGEVAEGYLAWPMLPDVLPAYFAGVNAKRDDAVVDIDRGRLVERMKQYFNPELTHEQMARICPRAMEKTARFDPIPTREFLCRRGFLPEYVVPFYYRPFDLRWVYWEPETRLLGEKSPEYFPHVQPGNVWMMTQRKPRRDWSPPQFMSALGCLDLLDRGASCFPLKVFPSSKAGKLFGEGTTAPKPNLSGQATAYLQGLGFADLTPGAEGMFYHVLAMLHAPAYSRENAGALRQDWPRVPLPDSRKALESSAALGRKVAALLDTESEVPAVTAGKIEDFFRTVGKVAKVGGGALDVDGGELAVTAGWGHGGKDGVTMPAKGRITARPYEPAELDAIADAARARGLSTEGALALLGSDTRDVYLNEKAYWRNVPANVWEYFIGGYQVIKKWLSYREHKLLGRPLRADEAREVMNMARRLSAIVLMQPALDENYRRAAGNCYPWPRPADTGTKA